MSTVTVDLFLHSLQIQMDTFAKACEKLQLAVAFDALLFARADLRAAEDADPGHIYAMSIGVARVMVTAAEESFRIVLRAVPTGTVVK